ncbi:hypothetical protein [Budvicia aquatica]|uniref:Uncharacterized protein conserved in bacteria n=1 Tax=Budvicia aquatica TaxID=82979 RepID=A0A2C6DG38_9GAMM|nr:hypothetical protein [Budvicia aquatica]PHI30166.1 hypothetical protein CRN84_12860 [Budvicia aquatica]VFS49190.1 Uncharacterized protein conserved in bacteria [Budvicia aquatica]
MINLIITEICGLVGQALNSGQKTIPMHIVPFEMAKEDMNNYQDSTDLSFRQSLKPAYDYFEQTWQVPAISVIDIK